jgi:hypothetical protein
MKSKATGITLSDQMLREFGVEKMSICESSDGNHMIPEDADVVVFGELKNLEKDIPVRINYLTSLINAKAAYGSEQAGGYLRGKRDAYQEIMAVLVPGEMDRGNADILLEAAARHERVAKAKAAIHTAIRVDEDQYRHVSMEKLRDAVDGLDELTLRELVLDHVYRGGSFN